MKERNRVEVENVKRAFWKARYVQMRNAVDQLTKARDLAKRMVEKYEKKLLVTATLLAFSLGFVHGCQTIKGTCKLIEGAGKDTAWIAQKLGDNIQDTDNTNNETNK